MKFQKLFSELDSYIERNIYKKLIKLIKSRCFLDMVCSESPFRTRISREKILNSKQIYLTLNATEESYSSLLVMRSAVFATLNEFAEKEYFAF